jgi:hypothetical protein
MNPYLLAVLTCVVLALAMVGCALIGHRIGRRRHLADADAKELSTGTVDAAILSLLGLLIAFTFSNAYGRFEARRSLIVDEANAISTAYLRLELLPEATQLPLKLKFKQYVRSRHQLWRLMPDREAALAEYDRSVSLQNEIWSAAVDATQGGDGQTRMLLLPALNEMIDITTTRMIAVQSHPPLMIYLLLAALALASGAISGFGMARASRPSYPHFIVLALASALALYVILDIEFPRFGLVTLDFPHTLLSDLEEQMTP